MAAIHHRDASVANAKAPPIMPFARLTPRRTTPNLSLHSTRVVQHAWGVQKCTPGACNFACSGRFTPLKTGTVRALLGRAILIASTSFQLRSRGILHAKDCLSTVCVPGVCRACYRVCTAI